MVNAIAKPWLFRLGACVTVALLAIFLWAGDRPSAATNLWLGDEDLRSAFAGRTIAGRYASGKEFTEDYRADGTLTYVEPGRRSEGRWSVTSGTFCTIYDIDPTGGCFRVARVGANCFEFYFVARTRAQAKEPRDRDKPAWTAVAWFIEEDSTCEDPSFV